MMKPTSLLIALALLGTGCTGGNATDSPAAEAPTETSPPTSPSPTASAGGSESPTATGSPSPAPPATTAPQEEEPTDPPAEQPPSDSPSLSPRGNVVKEIGEDAGIIDGNGERLVNFVVNSISTNVICTEESAQPAENGLFVAVDVSVQTSPAMADPDALITTFDMSPWMFSAISPRGISSNADPGTFASFTCMDDSVLLPSSIGPGENAEGIVLLDLQYPSGILVFEDFHTGGSWEWEYPG